MSMPKPVEAPSPWRMPAHAPSVPSPVQAPRQPLVNPPVKSPVQPRTRRKRGGGGGSRGGGGGDGSSHASPEDVVALELALVEHVSAVGLKDLLSALELFYNATLWLHRASESEEADPYPDNFSPTDDDVLWVEHLEIGTPNKLRVKGKASGVVRLVAFLGSALALPVAATEAYKNYAEAQKAIVEARLVEVEIIEKSLKLRDDGRISHAACERQQRSASDIIALVPSASKVVAPRPMILSRPTVDSSDRQEAPALTASSLAILEEAGAQQAAPLLAKYFAARHKYLRTSDPASLKDVETAYSHIHQALSPIEHGALHLLLERLERSQTA